MDAMATFGKSMQIPFIWKGCALWMGADYYREETGVYLVSFKAGFQHGWFALSMDYGICLDLERISCSNDEIEATLLRQMEERQAVAGDRCIMAAYYARFYKDQWMQNGNAPSSKILSSLSPYPFREGIHDSILIDGSKAEKQVYPNYFICISYYYCCLDREGNSINVFATTTNSGFTHMCSIPFLETDDLAAYIYGYICENSILSDHAKLAETTLVFSEDHVSRDLAHLQGIYGPQPPDA